MSASIIKAIKEKIVILQKVKGLTESGDSWELQTLITNYHLVIAILDTTENVDMEKITKYLEPLEKRFEYFQNFVS